MNTYFDQSAPKKPTNVSINSDLLEKAKSLKVNLSATLEAALSEVVARRQAELWREENQEAIAAYNAMVAEPGLFADDERTF